MESQPLLILLGSILTCLTLAGIFLGWTWVALIVGAFTVFATYLNRPSQRRNWRAEYEAYQATNT